MFNSIRNVVKPIKHPPISVYWTIVYPSWPPKRGFFGMQNDHWNRFMGWLMAKKRSTLPSGYVKIAIDKWPSRHSMVDLSIVFCKCLPEGIPTKWPADLTVFPKNSSIRHLRVSTLLGVFFSGKKTKIHLEFFEVWRKPGTRSTPNSLIPSVAPQITGTATWLTRHDFRHHLVWRKGKQSQLVIYFSYPLVN